MEKTPSGQETLQYSTGSTKPYFTAENSRSQIATIASIKGHLENIQLDYC